MVIDYYIRTIQLLRDKIKDMDKYPFNLPVVKFLDKIDFHEYVTFLVWENWSGKSTLLEAIAIEYGFNPEGWSKNFNFTTAATHSVLSKYIGIVKWMTRPKDWYFLRAESFYNVATKIDQLDEWGGGKPIRMSYWGKSLHKQSHWESFFSLFLHRLFWHWLYILDEPEAALSPARQLSLLVRLHELVKQKSQFIIATHSPILLSYPHAKIIEISDQWFKEINYKDTDHYKLYCSFLNNSDWFIKNLWIDIL